MDYHSPLLHNVGEEVRFPAKCESTGEAILLTAKLLQLGATKVCRSLPDAQLRVDEVANTVLRTMTFRDEVTHMDWQKFLQKPVK